ncbi:MULTISPECIES: ABC transporter substrate-binding protein [Streptosporangium]|uniref:Multiple sugar transport system substrate-binding protein n=1 Tax=Streptosporangium brasiliense TaxID=47480 RepID=A0ABT9RKI3_9ACTN|nr:sugar ABC transporter substrate-binding protein [Streptosporangium brasiliense]MDP9869808.1 multiple sugar transport system substrate-binding protein [Streptosporangium brasiliense]
MRNARAVAGAATALITTLAAAACGGGDGTPRPAAASASSAGPVTIEWWGWAPGYDRAAAAWNASHPDIQVKYTQVEPGAKGGYQKMLGAVKAGNAPCLAQVGAETMASFLIEGALEDITDLAKDVNSKIQPWAVNTVTFGGRQFGIPVDTGPMGMFYRKDLFDKFEIEVPKTWDEFAAAAEKIHKADPDVFLTSFNPDDMYGFSGFAWQAGARWFATEGDSWKVNVADAPTLKVAGYWQGLLDRKLLDVKPGWSDAWFKDFSDGKIASLVSAVWMTKVLEDSIPKTKGKWAVAPMPQWEAGRTVTGNVGGSPNAVLKGCAAPREAVEFAGWLSTDAAAVDGLMADGGLFPAGVAGGASPSMQAGRPFYGDQPVFRTFADSAGTVAPDFGWGPTTPALNDAFVAAVGRAVSGGGTLQEALRTVQEKAVASIKDKGLNVSQG